MRRYTLARFTALGTLQSRHGAIEGAEGTIAARSYAVPDVSGGVSVAFEEVSGGVAVTFEEVYPI